MSIVTNTHYYGFFMCRLHKNNWVDSKKVDNFFLVRFRFGVYILFLTNKGGNV